MSGNAQRNLDQNGVKRKAEESGEPASKRAAMSLSAVIDLTRDVS